MDESDSFDSENLFSDSDSENMETKAGTSISQKKEKEEEEEDEGNEIINIDLIKSISQTLETILENNKHLMNSSDTIKKQSKMVFSSRIIPNISIEEYLMRIHTYSNIEKSTLILSLIYIDRFCKNSRINLTYNNIYRILFTSILLSIKYNEDQYFDNKYYAEIAGVKLKELNILEYNFAQMMNYSFFVNDEIYKKYKLYLDSSIYN